jgi:hypothetical protein
MVNLFVRKGFRNIGQGRSSPAPPSLTANLPAVTVAAKICADAVFLEAPEVPADADAVYEKVGFSRVAKAK